MNRLMVVVIVLVLTACSSSSASDPTTQTEINALRADLENLRSEFEALVSAFGELEASLKVRSLKAGDPNPVQIAPTYPVYYETTTCTGVPYIVGHTFSAFALRHGVAVRFTEPGTIDGTAETYGYIARNQAILPHVDIRSILDGPENCREVDGAAIAGYTVHMADDDYEAITGVPAGGFTRGATIGTTPAFVGDRGASGARHVDVWTDTGYLVRIDAEAAPARVE